MILGNDRFLLSTKPIDGLQIPSLLAIWTGNRVRTRAGPASSDGLDEIVVRYQPLFQIIPSKFRWKQKIENNS